MEDKTVNIETATAPDKKLLLRAAAWGFAAAIVRWAILAVGLFRHSTAMTNLCRILSVVSGVGFGVAFVVFIVRRGRNISAWMLALLDVSGYVVGELAVRLLFPLLRLIPRDAPYDTFENRAVSASDAANQVYRAALRFDFATLRDEAAGRREGAWQRQTTCRYRCMHGGRGGYVLLYSSSC